MYWLLGTIKVLRDNWHFISFGFYVGKDLFVGDLRFSLLHLAFPWTRFEGKHLITLFMFVIAELNIFGLLYIVPYGMYFVEIFIFAI